jgi:transcriptional regulator with XRE-family HTH domain
MEQVTAELRARLAHSGLRLGHVALRMGMDASLISRILNNQRPMPVEFPEQFEAALRAAAGEKAKHLQAVAAGEPEEEKVPA